MKYLQEDNIPRRFLQKIREAKEQQLEELDLSNEYGADDQDKLTRIPEEVFALKQLKVLKLNNNRISELPESLGNLANLTGLYLSDNQISSLPESLGNLTNLTGLNLSRNQISSLPESLGNLTNLTGLYLSRNQISSLPESLGNLTNLTGLYLGENQISSLPESLGNLANLTGLNLGENQISSLPESLGNLANLTVLYLAGNQISSLPEFLGNLTNLTELYLWGNQISSLPESLGNLTNLTELYLSRNQISSLPESLGNLTNLTELNLSDNPLVDPPIEIAEKGIEAIRNYFRQQKEVGTGYIYEAKLLIVGEPGAGKTTLAKKIENPAYQLQQDEESTKGIDVIKWTFPLDNGYNFQINIWDFGGQEIYKATHRFFLTKRSLYTLVVDNREENDNLYYWLNIVELLSDNSPLLIIKNEKQNRQRDINELDLRGQFSNIKETFSTNLATNDQLVQILNSIKHYIINLDHIGEKLPTTWIRVRQTLESDKRDYISLPEFFTICQEKGITRVEDKLLLIGYLHDLGVCLHFQEEEESILYKTVILKPEWATDAVYKVLDNPKVIDEKGYFDRNSLKDIWHESKYKPMRGELLKLMMKFELCYEIPDRKNNFIAPQLLTENQPRYDWNKHNNLSMRYNYPYFMPTGIVTRFIVVMHEYIDQQKFVWKSGVILKQNNTKAEIIEYYGRREITIRTSGENQRDLMTIISHQLDRISDSYQGLKYDKLIPCNCDECKTSSEPYFHPFKVLQKAKQKGQRQVQCQTSFEMLDVIKLIDDVIIYRDEQLNPEDRYKNTFKYESSVPINNIINVATNGNNQMNQDNRSSQVGNIGRDYKPQNSPTNSDNAKINNNTNPSSRKKIINWGIILAVIGIIASFTGGLMNPEIREKLRIDSPQPSPELPGNKNIE